MSYDPDPFTVAVKDSARDENRAVRRLVRAEGDRLDFDSEAAAHRRARELSADGDAAVKVQRAAPQDPDDVDGYLVGWPDRRTRTPEGTPTEGLTFDTEANQYGALGEALVCTPAVNPPLLTHFARVDADLPTEGVDDDRLRVELDTDPEPVVVRSDRRWEPDCRAVVRLGPDRPVLTEYWCEVKAGDGSFERSQRAAMRAKAREATVLKIRVDLDDLPESYTAWVRRVEPEDGDGEELTYRVNSELGDFA
ncbi:hypothetical protein [Halorussus sp. AFM4]|uniref:hypothetical protein n=1 Tax=Halorussus sp. AFM4 TaxID=3421651 RepID=UPI003EB8859B